ncbi:MAG: GNAT family N-acetyltransferase [Nitriliruptoraceae bacterium]|nr:GNAT family N-acetyltransferase [Nitriliruptoraceae bacterium]
MRLADLAAADVDAALALWAATEHVAPVPRDELEVLLGRDERLVVAAREDDVLVGVVIGTFDGRRGWIQRLAVHPEARGRGVGRALVTEVESRLHALGCRRVNLLTFADNVAGQRFWARAGYRPAPAVALFHRQLDGDTGDVRDGSAC